MFSNVAHVGNLINYLTVVKDYITFLLLHFGSVLGHQAFWASA